MENKTLIYKQLLVNEIELRDYFAAKVLEGIHSNNDMWVAMCMDKRNCTRDKENDTYEDYVAQQCYKMADAMLKEREHDVVGRNEQVPILDRCGCEEPNEEPIKVCMNCNGYVE